LIKNLSLQSIEYLAILLLANNISVSRLLTANSLDLISNIVLQIIDQKVINIDFCINSNETLSLLIKINILYLVDLVANQEN